MCRAVGASLQHGMNYRLNRGGSIFLMSRRVGAPYEDEIDELGATLIYEGHDHPQTAGVTNPKVIDQPAKLPSGRLTRNGLFLESVRRYKEQGASPELIRVFEKIKDGIWVYNGVFELFDAWTQSSNGRAVFKFHLRLIPDDAALPMPSPETKDEDDRIIPSWVKQEVWKRDKGKCALCGSVVFLHFDHIIPYSRGGSSKEPKNIRILCRRHNLQKRDNIE
jgi:hypothetical protein